MMFNSNLNLQVWLHISKYLEFQDLLNLRLVDKELFIICGSDFIWKNIVFNRWYLNDLKLNGSIPININYYQYFKSRFNEDLEIKTLLKDLNLLGEPLNLLKLAYEIVNENTKYVTALKELKNDEDLSVRYLSGSILNSIRMRNVLNYFKLGVDHFKTDLEDFFLNMSQLDNSFDHLLYFRTKFYDEIFLIISYSNIVSSNTLTNTEKVIFIITKIQKYLQSKTDYRIDKNFRSDIMPSSEDYSILRVYAGEVIGVPEIRYSIIEKVCKYFSLNLKVTNSFIIVEDNSYEDNISLINLENDIAVITKQALINDLERIGYPFNLDLIINNFDFNPFIDPLSQIDDGSIYYHFKPHIATFNYIFQNSNSKLNHSWLEFISQKEELNFLQYDDISIYDFLNNLIGVFLRRFDPLLLINLEFDLFEIFKNFNGNSKDLMFWIFNEIKDIYYDYPASEISYDVIDPFFKLGQVVYLKKSNSYNIILKQIPRFNQIELLLKNEPNQQTFAHEEDLEIVNKVSDEVLNYLKSDLIIGKYFERFDEVKQCFTPKKFILERTSPCFLPT